MKIEEAIPYTSRVLRGILRLGFCILLALSCSYYLLTPIILLASSVKFEDRLRLCGAVSEKAFVLGASTTKPHSVCFRKEPSKEESLL
jgi:hypothetical protein